jgi:hypothetical protein
VGYLELREPGDAGPELVPRAVEVEPRELADALVQLPVHGGRRFVALPSPSLSGRFILNFFFCKFFLRHTFLREETAPHAGVAEP